MATEKRHHQNRVDNNSFGILSEFYEPKELEVVSNEGSSDHTLAASLVGRAFQYVTRQGLRKTYLIQSYVPWKGAHRVQRCLDDGKEDPTKEYKTKVIKLEELPNIVWLDNDRPDNDVNDKDNSEEQAIEMEKGKDDNYQKEEDQGEKDQEEEDQGEDDQEEVDQEEDDNHNSPPIKQAKRKVRSRMLAEIAPHNSVGLLDPDIDVESARSTRWNGLRRPSRRSNEEKEDSSISRRSKKRKRNEARLRNDCDESDPPHTKLVRSISDGTSSSSYSNSSRSVSSNNLKQKHERIDDDGSSRLPLGTTVYKVFEDDSGEREFTGTIKSYDPKTKWYCIQYEDGDKEELYHNEVKKLLESGEQTTTVSSQYKVQRSNPWNKTKTSSQYNGVSYINTRWQAQCFRKDLVQRTGKPYIGTFKTEIEAAKAVDEFVRKHGGPEHLDFLNFPTTSEKKTMEGGVIPSRAPKQSNSKPSRAPKQSNSKRTTSEKKTMEGSVIPSRAPKQSNSKRYRGVAFCHQRNRSKPWLVNYRTKKFIERFGKAYIAYANTELEGAKIFDECIRKHMDPEDFELLNFPTPAEQRAIKKNQASKVTPKTSKINASARAITPQSVQERVSPSPIVGVKSQNTSFPAKGDRIAFGFGSENSVHFGTVTDCGLETQDERSHGQDDRKWTVDFDTGETYELDCQDITNSVELYQKILKAEESYPLPIEGGPPEVGKRTAFGFGASGIYFGRITKSGSGDKGAPRKRWAQKCWTVEFDDGEVHDFDVLQINKSLDLYRRIRQKKDARSLLVEDDSDDSKQIGNIKRKPTVAIQKLLDMGSGDRIAYDFGNAGVYFGSVDEAHASYENPRKDWKWEIIFDDGELYELDSFEMIRSVTLYEKIKEKEQNDPKCDKKIREWTKDFLLKKERLEKKLPISTKKRFREVGFAKWGKMFLPVLFLGPFDVHPGSIRRQWMEAFEKYKKEKEPSGKLPQIVYWFGESFDRAFSIIDEANCLSLKEGKKQGLLRMKEAKSKAAAKHNHAIKLLQEANAKDPELRLPSGKVREIHERLTGPKADRLVAEVEAAKQIGTEEAMVRLVSP